MPILTHNQWLNKNANRSFPVIAEGGVSRSDRQMEALKFILDLSLSVNLAASGHRVFLKSIGILDAIVSVTFGIGSEGDHRTATAVAPIPSGERYDEFDVSGDQRVDLGPAGRVVIGPRPAGLEGVRGVIDYGYGWVIDPKCLTVDSRFANGESDSVTSIVSGDEIMVEDLILDGGDSILFEVELEDPGIPDIWRVTASLVDPDDYLPFCYVPTGGAACACGGRILETINGVPPDVNGVIKLIFSGVDPGDLEALRSIEADLGVGEADRLGVGYMSSRNETCNTGVEVPDQYGILDAEYGGLPIHQIGHPVTNYWSKYGLGNPSTPPPE